MPSAKTLLPYRVLRHVGRGVTRRTRKALYSALAPVYRSYCPVCDFRVREFLPIEEVYERCLREHGWPHGLGAFETLSVDRYRCPHCGSTDRDRLYAHWMTRSGVLHGSEPVRLLDIAPTGPMQTFFRRRPEVKRRTADLFASGVDDRVDIQDMPIYGEGQFDAFLCSHVLEHVEDDRRAMKELYRVLRPGGWGIAMVPICTAVEHCDEDPSVKEERERWRRFAQHDHVRLYSKRCWIERLSQAGFHVEALGASYFGADVLDRMGLTATSVLYVVRKPADSRA